MFDALRDTGSTGGQAPRRRATEGLVVLSVALLLVSCVAYVALLPTLLPTADSEPGPGSIAEAPKTETGEKGEDARADEEPQEAQDETPAGEKGDAPDDVKDDAQAADDVTEGSDSELTLPETNLEGTPSVEAPEGEQDKDQPAGEKDDAPDVSQETEPDAAPDKEPGATPKPEPEPKPEPKPEPTPEPEPTPNPTPTPEPADPGDNMPSAAEEQEFRAFLAGKAQLLPGYISQVNACVSAFEADSLSPDLSVRLADQRTCNALSYQLLNEYLAVRDRPRSNNSQYCDEQEELISMYRLLGSYLGCYESAWTINVAYEDPASHTAEFMAPLGSAQGYLAEFQAYYQGFSI